MLRVFRLSDGRWLDVTLTSAEFTTPLAVNVAEFAKAVGAPVEGVEAADDADPRSGPLVTVPAAPPRPIEPDVAAILAILAKADADVTAADMKTALLLYLRRRNRLGAL